MTFPARPFIVHGERRTFPLLRAVDDATAEERVRQLVLQAYGQHAAETADKAVS